MKRSTFYIKEKNMADMATEVRDVLRGHTGHSPYGSTAPRAGGGSSPLNSDEDIPLIEAGDANALIDEEEFLFDDCQCEDAYSCIECLNRDMESDRALLEAEAREAQRVEEERERNYLNSLFHPFFNYQHHREGAKQVAQVRSEVYEVAGSLGGRMRHVNPCKHQQFFGGVRIH